MTDQSLNLSIQLQDEVDDEELDQLTRQVRDEIAELGVETVRLAPGNTVPRGAKGEPITLGSIIVALASAGVFTGLMEVLKSWVLRRDRRTVTFKARIDEQEVELTYGPSNTSPQEMSRFVSAVVGRLQKGRAS